MSERNWSSHDRVASDRELSPREHDIVELIARGQSNNEIAAVLFLSVNTVKTHIRGAYAKMGVTSRTQAVIWAVRHDLVDTGAILNSVPAPIAPPPVRLPGRR